MENKDARVPKAEGQFMLENEFWGHIHAFFQEKEAQGKG